MINFVAIDAAPFDKFSVLDHDRGDSVTDLLLTSGSRLSACQPIPVASLKMANRAPLGPILLSVPWDNPSISRHSTRSEWTEVARATVFRIFVSLKVTDPCRVTPGYGAFDDVKQRLGSIQRREFLDTCSSGMPSTSRESWRVQSLLQRTSRSPVAQSPHSGRTILLTASRQCRPCSLRLAASLSRSVPDANRSVIYEFTKDAAASAQRICRALPCRT
jgi:hypothetical protein